MQGIVHLISLIPQPTNSEQGYYLSIGDKGSNGSKYFHIGRSGSYTFALRIYGNADLATDKVTGWLMYMLYLIWDICPVSN